MLLLRFIVALASRPLPRCASAHRCIRVPTPPRHIAAPRFAHASAGTCDALNDPHPSVTVRPCFPGSRFGDRLPFKSHSAPRPPHTPAPSPQPPHRQRLGSSSLPP